ncbi:hypothetical protein A946_10545 [Methylacidiphilum kamchatkense Kam1]|uniref:Uncharacterized protein n=1 Tax=Methylacidiphilum kamchatkense Kam1 TaxID=1202785 RepID=A0ABR4ZVV1_9BACT|nr:hypothetical protein [Methylacidiphilum kamchatkense]KIE57886.1 hypothetical protein A946_10545 [Methylacidiphilum kamchatkense Kam1]
MLPSADPLVPISILKAFGSIFSLSNFPDYDKLAKSSSVQPSCGKPIAYRAKRTVARVGLRPLYIFGLGKKEESLCFLQETLFPFNWLESARSIGYPVAELHRQNALLRKQL